MFLCRSLSLTKIQQKIYLYLKQKIKIDRIRLVLSVIVMEFFALWVVITVMLSLSMEHDITCKTNNQPFEIQLIIIISFQDHHHRMLVSAITAVLFVVVIVAVGE